MALLRAVRRTLPPDGDASDRRADLSVSAAPKPVGDAYFAFYLLAMGSGRPRTFARLKQMLVEAGFTDIALRPAGLPMLTSIITAQAGRQFC